MAHRGVELERVQAERAVAVHDDDLLVGLGDLGADSERQSDAHGAERPGIEPMARREGRHRLAAEVQDFLPVDHEDGVALHEILDLVAQPQRMDRHLVDRLVGARRLAFRRLAVGQRSPPCGETVRIDAPGARVDELAEHRLAVADDADIDLARARWRFRRHRYRCARSWRRVEAGRRRVADDVVHAGADHDDQIGVAERGRAHGQIGIFMIVRHDAAALRRGVERNAGRFDEAPAVPPRPATRSRRCRTG